jgi:MFS transporter, putative metabolite transport protein
MTTTVQSEPVSAGSFKRFQTKVAVCASGGKFCDGWILATIGLALPLASLGLEISPLMQGLIGSSSLIGLFIGGLVFGWVTDQIGRKTMFLWTLLTFLVCSVLQFFVVDEWQLFALRLVMGMAIGADYAIAGAMIAEFTNKGRRGPSLAGMLVWWYAGFCTASTLAILTISALPESTGLWRWILASSFVPALVMLVLRIGLPESPRWLMSRGRAAEAQSIASRYLEPETREDTLKETSAPATYASLFSKRNIRKTALTSIFWMSQITPFYAIYIFLPQILEEMNFRFATNWAEVLLYLFLLVGSMAGALVINRLGRRTLLISTFVMMAVPLLVLGIWTQTPPAVIILCFIVFSFFHAAGSVLQMLYPSEIFPTEIRATGIGFAAGMSRVGAAIGTFLLPIGLASWGTGPVMLVGVGVCVLGLIVSVMWAPETTGLELSEATGAAPSAQAPRSVRD